MKTIFILVPQSAVPSGLTAPRYLFNTANTFLNQAGKPSEFEVKLVGEFEQVCVQDDVFYASTDYQLDHSGHPDLVIIPPLFGNLQNSLNLNKNLRPWIRTQYENGAEIASLCLGAFLLASTRLLDGKSCSTHWAFYDQFSEWFPEVEIKDGAVITDENGIYTSGGANSLWNLLLYLLEKYTDRETAIQASKYFAIDIDRDNQSYFMMFNGQKNHPDIEVRKTQNYLENHFQDKITVDDLADMVGMSRRSFERRFKHATGNTVIRYLQRIKVEAAKRSFESSRKNISEVMYDVGYNDTKAFRSVFKRITGLSPIEYRNKFYKMTS